MAGSAFHQARSVARYAAQGLGQGAGVHSLAMGIIALCLAALGAAGLVVVNISRVADAWNSQRMVTVFLSPAADPALVAAVVERARADTGVLEVRVVDRALVRARLREALGARASLLEDVEDHVVPTAVELELAPAAPLSAARTLAEAMRAMPGVEEVNFGEEELGRLDAVVDILRAGGALLAALIAAVAVLVISNTLKLTVLARRQEIEIMRLVGAGDVFVRAPFVLEGALQGLGGAALAGGLLVGLHQALALQVEHTLSLAFGPVSLGGTPWEMVGWLLLAGTMLGVVGGLLGVSRFAKA